MRHDVVQRSKGWDSLRKRRSYYQLSKELPVSEEVVRALIEETTELVPDAFNMKSARVAVALGEKQDELWDRIYDAFQGKVARERSQEKRLTASRQRRGQCSISARRIP